ncbi:MAG: hypothetical protein CBC42_02195 [Betaproteobacteria bacterium TMED82]|nr:MAG: hypothetical protein CBC42_02195 [Betaproteobacteria bacterium TMED82]
MFQILVVIGFTIVIYNLIAALFNMVSSKRDSKKMLRALALRVFFSILIFVSILTAHHFDLITSSGIPVS